MPVQRRSTVTEGTPSVHLLRIQLEGMKPPLWRRLVVPSDLTLGSLHDLVQVMFGWDDSHLHAFEDRRGGRYAPPGMLDLQVFDEEGASLADVVPHAGDRLDYTYDFGDDWLHRVTVEGVRPAEPGESDVTDRNARAVCTGGRRAMPPAEDLGGVWGLTELLERYENKERPRPTVVRDAGQEWLEYDGLHDEVLAGLHEAGFDPAAFDAAEVTRELADIALRRLAGRGGRAVVPAPRGGNSSVAGGPDDPDTVGVEYRTYEDHEDDGEDDVRDLLTEAGIRVPALRLPAVRLPVDRDLAEAVRAVPLFMAMVRLGHWCGNGRQLTPTGVLRPKLARQAVEEAELWRVDPDEWGDPADRAARLAKIRSAGDMEPVSLPWEWALVHGFVEVDGGRAFPGPLLPDLDDDTALLTAWQDVTAGSAAVQSTSLPGLDVPPMMAPRLLELTDAVPPLVFLMLLAAYGLPDGEWLDLHGFLTDGLAEMPAGAARRLASALLAGQYENTAETLESFGAAERDGQWSRTDAGRALMFDDGTVDLLPTGSFRLTPLGRSGLRVLALEVGVPAPLIGTLARADARDLLAALPSYPSDADAASEVRGWLAERSPADATVQIVDACEGTEPVDSLRRLQVPRVLTAVLDADTTGRAKAVLRKAAVSQVAGCSHAAASMLRRIGEPVEGQAPWGLEWMLVDGALPFTVHGEEAARERLLGTRRHPGGHGRAEGDCSDRDNSDDSDSDGGQEARPVDQLAEHADTLWRAGHPHTGEVLGVLAAAVAPVDKALAKRLRKSAFKAESARDKGKTDVGKAKGSAEKAKGTAGTAKGTAGTAGSTNSASESPDSPVGGRNSGTGASW